MGVAAAPGAAKMNEQKIEKSLHSSNVHGGEPPCATRERRLAFIVAIAAEDFLGVDFNAGKIDGARRRRSHAMRGPLGKIRALAFAQARHDHEAAALLVGRR